MKYKLFFCVFILFILTSCQMKHDALSSDINGSLTVSSEAADLNYDQYLKKIWIVKENDRDSEVINDYPSFFITDVSDGIITGSMSIGIRAFPNCYVKSFDSKNLIEFSGAIEDGVGKCQYGNNNSANGEIELIFKDDEIEAIICSSSGNDPVFSKIYGKKFVYHPYNIQDDKYMLDVSNCVTELNYWGKVNITTGYINANHPYAVAYITDNDGNILYEFKGMTNGVKVTDIKIEDINNDNLLDIKISLDYPDLEYIYIQMDDGLFYNSKLDINTNISNLETLP